MDITIEPAREQDGDGVLRLLRANELTTEGLLEHLGTTIVARHDGQVVGSAALEVYPEGALLRSVAVARELQHNGVGGRLTDAAIQRARDARVPAVFLLTTSAERYFSKFGFERMERQRVPQTVLASVEFRSACPSWATVMCKALD